MTRAQERAYESRAAGAATNLQAIRTGKRSSTISRSQTRCETWNSSLNCGRPKVECGLGRPSASCAALHERVETSGCLNRFSPKPLPGCNSTGDNLKHGIGPNSSQSVNLAKLYGVTAQKFSHQVR